MSEYPYAKLRAHERKVSALMADPDVTGDLLLVGLWLARATVLRQPRPTSGSGWQLSDIAASLYAPTTSLPVHFRGEQPERQEPGPDVWRVWQILKDDIRRYDPWADMPGKRGSLRRSPCGGPMVRRAVCGNPSNIGGFVTNLEDGRKRWLAACNKHHDWYWVQRKAIAAALQGVEVPRPPANAGGVLARHIDLDWPLLWRSLDPEWVQPPEVDSWARPALRLLVTSAPEPTVRERTGRPSLTVIEGGWR